MSIKIEGYEIIEKAGGTTDTTIWTARQISLDRNVSIWVMKARAAADTNLVNHFQAITRAISRLKHNNFPPVIDISTTPEGIPYIVFENAESTSITRIIKQRGAYAYHDALRIAKEVALALDTAWKQTGLVHRNLKPDNIRISDDGNIKIFNFNSATIVQPGTNPLAFDDGMVVGTPNYAAPEQIDCLPSIDYHADMYGLGAMLYHMVTGMAPFDEERDPMKILELQRSGHLPNPKVKNPALTDEVVYMIARLMAKLPEDRYAWWLDFVEDVEHVLSGRPLRMVPPNGIVRSTIDQKALVASPIVVNPNPAPAQTPLTANTYTPTAPIQAPVATPIIPVNNTPISAQVYSETVRNFESTAKNPIVPPIVPSVEIKPQVSQQPQAAAPIVPPIRQEAAPQAKPEQKKNMPPPKPRKQSIVSKYCQPNGLLVLVTRVACVALFFYAMFMIIKLLGPAGDASAVKDTSSSSGVAMTESTDDVKPLKPAKAASTGADVSEAMIATDVDNTVEATEGYADSGDAEGVVAQAPEGIELVEDSSAGSGVVEEDDGEYISVVDEGEDYDYFGPQKSRSTTSFVGKPSTSKPANIVKKPVVEKPQSVAEEPVAELDVASDETPRIALLRAAYNELASKDIASASARIKKLFDANSSKPGVNRAECRGIMTVLGAATNEREATGMALVRQTQIAFKKITIGGKTLEVKAYAYANGEVLCNARKVGGIETRQISIPIDKASPEEMYSILRAEPDTSKQLVITKAILALRTHNRGDFLRYTKSIKALQPFGEFIK